jgi:hypothetical protein
MTEDPDTSLTAAMMLRAATFVADYCPAHGYPPPTEQEHAEMMRLWREAFATFVAKLDRPDRDPTQSELETMEAMVEGVAQGSVLRVMGQPPGSEGDKN